MTSKIDLFSDLGGETWRILRFVDESDKRWSAFNPSIAYSPEQGYCILFRSSNYFFDPKTGGTVATVGNRIQNRVFIANLGDDWQVVPGSLRELDYSKGPRFLRGPEDGRLYWRDGGWEFLSVMREPYVTDDVPRLGTFRITGERADLLKVYDSPDLQPIEKNWMPPYKKTSKFDFVYSATSVYKEDIGKIYARDEAESVGNNIRGGSCLWELPDGSYLAIVHEADVKKETKFISRMFSYKEVPVRKYLHRFAKYRSDGTLTHLSDLFTFQNVDIEFAAGLVVCDEDVIVSYGYKDVASYLGKIKLKAVLDTLKEI
jgi:hypothetical protein